MKKYEYEPASLVLAFVLGPMFENALRQSLIISGGNPRIFLTRPISAVFVLVSLFLLNLSSGIAALGKKTAGVFGEGKLTLRLPSKLLFSPFQEVPF